MKSKLKIGLSYKDLKSDFRSLSPLEETCQLKIERIKHGKVKKENTQKAIYLQSFFDKVVHNFKLETLHWDGLLTTWEGLVFIDLKIDLEILKWDIKEKESKIKTLGINSKQWSNFSK